MDYYLLTDLAARVGYHLALSGAETFRVEETIRRIIGAYGIECEAFSIPNCVMVSLEAANGKPLMVMKRVGFHGNDLESVEKLNALVGKYINLAYRLPNGETVKFLDDRATYLGNQLECEFGGDRCFSIAANMDFLLVCTYEENGKTRSWSFTRRDKALTSKPKSSDRCTAAV